jgi:predicted metal-dependent hydrolase
MNQPQVEQFLCEALETEIGGIEIYEKALECARTPELKQEWQEYLEQTQHHEQVLRHVCAQLGIDPEQETPGREIVRATAEALIGNMDLALETADVNQAEIIAAEAITLAETKDHLNWQLIGIISDEAEGRMGEVLREAYDQVEDEEDEHLSHTRGWARELWAKALGLAAELPPAEEKMGLKANKEIPRQKSKPKHS